MSCHPMACLSWSPSPLPGRVIGARDQPRGGPNNEEPTVGPAPAAMSDLEARVFCGWYWGSTHHGVCVIDDGGTVLHRWLIAHNGERLAELFFELAEIAPPESLPIAIERGEGLVVELIAHAGHAVLMVDPAGFKAARPRWDRRGPSPISATRTCSPTTREPTVTDCGECNPWPTPLGTWRCW
jgi:hypothetical protein